MATRSTTAEAAAGEPGSSSPLPGEELASLRRLLVRAEGFALAFVRSNVPAESRLIAGELAATLTGEGVVVRELRLGEPVHDLHGEVAALEPSPEAGDAVVVTGFERSIPSGVDFPAALERLNLRRERFRDLPCPLVLVLPDYALDLLARKSPDFWAWRSGVFETRPIARRLDDSVLDGRLPTDTGLDNLPLERKRDHLEVLKTTLADLEREGPGVETDRGELSLRIAVLLLSLGEPEEALAHARSALELAGGEARTRAWAHGQIADILQARGDLDEALRIRREEEIPVYEKLGDVRARAVTMGKIGDILQARGGLDEALRIRREEQVPVYERLGDTRARAITMGKIADVLAARGELDEALRIYREEAIPALGKLGDVRTRAVAMGKIGDIVAARGDLDEALRIRREEQIPVYEKLGDVRSRAVTMGKIAGILQARGDLDEALRIYREEEIPVYEKLGDVRARALALGKIADVLAARGDLDEALRIYREEAIPVYEKLGDVRELLVARTNMASALLDRDQSGDSERAGELLAQALRDAERLRIPEADRIRSIIEARHLEPT